MADVLQETSAHAAGLGETSATAAASPLPGTSPRGLEESDDDFEYEEVEVVRLVLA